MVKELGEVKLLVPKAPQHVSDELGLEPASIYTVGEGRPNTEHTNLAPGGLWTRPA